MDDYVINDISGSKNIISLEMPTSAEAGLEEMDFLL